VLQVSICVRVLLRLVQLLPQLLLLLLSYGQCLTIPRSRHEAANSWKIRHYYY
jgi:hypothetical protein